MDLRGYPPPFPLGLILLSYPYSIHPEPEKLLFIGQMVVLWYLLRQVLHECPVLIGYFSMFFIATGLIEAIWASVNYRDGLFEPFPVSADRLFFQSGALFRIFGDHITGGSWHLAGTVQTKYAYYLSMGCIGTADRCTSCGNERSAWIAVVVSCAWVYALYRLDRKQAATRLRQHKRWYIIGGILGGILLLGGSASLYTLKKDSADGRFLMWKITTKAIQKQPITGTS